ncbi:MAG: NAD(P)H-hydrate dehydratase [Proteobacteria bacterium]|nr:NAD(P)H-hydrate dehydratase [Pseudomonadota bacterium]
MTHLSSTLSSPLYDNAAARAIDRAAQVALGISEYELMQRAGRAAFRHVQLAWPQARRIGIACGSGNNGGDGYVLARLARAAGCDVRVVCLPGGAARSDAARQASADWGAAGGETMVFDGALPAVDLWVDSLFGIGLARAPEGAALALIDAINGAGVDVLALDVPSGVDADRGHVPGAAIHAVRTLTFIVDKRGLHTGAALDHVGELLLDGLGVPDSVISRHSPTARLLNPDALVGWLPRRELDTNKGDFGHVLCVGGDHGMAGAVALAAEAALRCGAGLVSVATRADHVGALLARRPELMARAVEDAADFAAASARPGVLAVGPGLDDGDWGRALLALALTSGKPLVLDADALNRIAAAPRALPDAVLTPHPGEAGRLLGIATAQVQADRFTAAERLAERYACAVVLKGAGSIIAASGVTPCVIDAGNPGMATGGMGDVLTGVIAALRAQGLSAFDAAACGTLLHAAAGDAAAGEGMRGLLASDLFSHLRRLANPCA